MKKSTLRKPIYDLIKRIAGRDLTIGEHEDLKKQILACVENEKADADQSRATMTRQGTKLRAISRQFQNFYSKRNPDSDDSKKLFELLEKVCQTNS